MDYSLREYPKLVDVLSESLESVQGGIIADNMWSKPYLGYLCLYSRHSPSKLRGWYGITSDELKRKRERDLRRLEIMELAQKHWVGWNNTIMRTAIRLVLD